MSCTGWEDKIAQYAGGDLAAAEAPAVEEHLRSCSECAELARGMEGDRGLLGARPPELAFADFDGMRRQIRGRIMRERRVRRWAPAVAIAAALLIAVAVSSKHVKPPAVAPVQVAAVHFPTPAIAPVEAPPRPRPRRRIETASAPAVEMRITTADPDVIIILVPTTMENPHE